MSVDGNVISFKLLSQITDTDNAETRWTKNLGQFGFMLTAADVDQDGRDEILVPCADGHLRIIDNTETALPSVIDLNVSSGALYCVGAGYYGGKVRIVTGGVDEKLYIYTYNSSTSQYELFSTRALMDPGGVIRRVAVGNFNGDTGNDDEVAVFYKVNHFRGNCYIDVVNLFTAGTVDLINTLTYYWDDTTAPFEDDVSPTNDATNPPFDWTDKQLPQAYDIDNDGKAEIVAHWGVLHPTDRGTKTLLSTMISVGEKLTRDDYMDFATASKPGLSLRGKYVLQQAIPGNFSSLAGKELFTLYGNYLYLIDYTASKTLSFSKFGMAPQEFEFSDGSRLEGGTYDKIVLTGPVNGDDHFYVVDLTASTWPTQAWLADTANGKLKWVSNNLDDLEAKINSFTGAGAKGSPISVIVPSPASPKGASTSAELDAKVTSFNNSIMEWRTEVNSSAPVSNVVFYGMTSAKDNTPWLIKEWCRKLAAQGVHCCLNIGMHGDNYITPADLVDCFKNSIGTDGKCYLMLRALEVQDKNQMYNTYHNHIDALLSEVANAASSVYNKAPPKLIFDGKGAIFSAMTTAQKDYFFSWPRKKMVVLGAENSNVRIPEWNFAEKAGLWLNDDVQWWCGDVIGDNLAGNRVVEFGGVANGHIVLRQLLASYAMGASIFRINSVCEKTDYGDSSPFGRIYRQGIINFCKIAEKGIFPPAPSVDRLLGISPVAVAMPTPDRTHIKKQNIDHNWDLYTDPPATQNALDRLECWNAYTKVPANDATAFLYGSVRRWDNLLPTSPGGFVPVVPFSGTNTLQSKSWCSKAYQTDGKTWSGYSTLTAAKTAIAADLLAKRSLLKFYVDGTCFWQVTQQDGDANTLFVMLMDNNTLSPTSGTVILKMGSASGTWNVYDQLSTTPWTSIDTLSSTSGLNVSIPMGSVRFLRLKKQ